jgi:hypothetical protein
MSTSMEKPSKDLIKHYPHLVIHLHNLRFLGNNIERQDHKQIYNSFMNPLTKVINECFTKHAEYGSGFEILKRLHEVTEPMIMCSHASKVIINEINDMICSCRKIMQ